MGEVNKWVFDISWKIETNLCKMAKNQPEMAEKWPEKLSKNFYIWVKKWLKMVKWLDLSTFMPIFPLYFTLFRLFLGPMRLVSSEKEGIVSTKNFFPRVFFLVVFSRWRGKKTCLLCLDIIVLKNSILFHEWFLYFMRISCHVEPFFSYFGAILDHFWTIFGQFLNFHGPFFVASFN